MRCSQSKVGFTSLPFINREVVRLQSIKELEIKKNETKKNISESLGCYQIMEKKKLNPSVEKTKELKKLYKLYFSKERMDKKKLIDKIKMMKKNLREKQKKEEKCFYDEFYKKYPLEEEENKNDKNIESFLEKINKEKQKIIIKKGVSKKSKNKCKSQGNNNCNNKNKINNIKKIKILDEKEKKSVEENINKLNEEMKNYLKIRHESYMEKMGQTFEKEFQVLKDKFHKEKEEEKIKINKIILNKKMEDITKDNYSFLNCSNFIGLSRIPETNWGLECQEEIEDYNHNNTYLNNNKTNLRYMNNLKYSNFGKEIMCFPIANKTFSSKIFRFKDGDKVFETIIL